MHSRIATVWEFILHKRHSGNEVILLYVADSRGSSPGRRGFHMAVSSDQHFAGTIGGGVMEYKFVEMARSLFTSGHTKPSVHRQVHSKKAEKQSGMICSGEQTILVYKLQEDDYPEIDTLVRSLAAWQKGTLQISNEGIRFSTDVNNDSPSFFEQQGEDFLYREQTGCKDELNIIGGGHCSLALSELMSKMNFYIRVYDDRPNLSTMAANHFANEMHTLQNYEELRDLIPDGHNQYVVIMTMGYRSDDQAFRTLAGKKFRYIGMLGSKSKINTLADSYRNEIPGLNLDQLYAPAGLDIKSETTYEIAVSIAAQIIMVRNNPDHTVYI